MYADYGYYIDEYLCGKNPAIPDSEFGFWEKQARREIDARTFGRVKKLAEIPEEVKDCVCAIAEVFYSADQVEKIASEAGAAGPLVSYSNDGQSGTFAAPSGIYTTEGRKAEVQRLIWQYLGNTGLLYAGVMQCES